MPHRYPTPQDAAELLRLCELAYSQSVLQTEQDARRLGFSEISSVGGPCGAHAIVVGCSSRVIVAFRGTQPTDPADLISDLRSLPQLHYRGGYVHRGFAAYVNSIWDELFPLIMLADKRPLIFTGHSLGGAAALLAAAKCAAFRRSIAAPLPHVVTAGAPRIGSRSFCRYVADQCSSITAITHGLDPVPWVPLVMHRHPARVQLHLCGGGHRLTNPTLLEQLRILPGRLLTLPFRFVWGVITQLSILRALIGVMSVKDHFLNGYQAEWQKWMENNDHVWKSE